MSAPAPIDARWFREHAGAFAGSLAFDEPLARHTWYRIGGPAAVLAVPRTRADLEWLRQGLRQTTLPAFTLGMGSNLLVSETGFAGVVIKTGRLNVEIAGPAGDSGPAIVRAGASVPVSSLLRRASTEGWGGLEFLAGVPGSVGGAVRMNAGTHLGEAKDSLRAVDWFDLAASDAADPWRRTGREGLRFEYRRNLFLPESGLVWAAEWEVRREMPARVKSVIDETLARRKATQPIDQPSCGSVFKNPRESGLSAWQVIDRLGLRGHRVGGAEFSPKHCNFIVNVGGARADDIHALILLAKRRAREELGVTLEEEVRYVGEFGPVAG